VAQKNEAQEGKGKEADSRGETKRKSKVAAFKLVSADSSRTHPPTAENNTR
jgi:hypothetical protein